MANVNTTPRMTSYDYGHQEKIMAALMGALDCASYIHADAVASIAEIKQSMFNICEDITYSSQGLVTIATLCVLKTWNQGQGNFGLAFIDSNGNIGYKPQMSNELVFKLIGIYIDHMELDYLRPVGERRMRIANAKNFVANCKSWNPYSKTVA